MTPDEFVAKWCNNEMLLRRKIEFLQDAIELHVHLDKAERDGADFPGIEDDEIVRVVENPTSGQVGINTNGSAEI